jgi:hypothetical protein
MITPTRILTAFAALGFSMTLHAAGNPFIGRWALTLPGGGAGWLGVEDKDGKISSTILWGGGSVVPVTTSTLDGDTLVVTRISKDKDKNEIVETITAKVKGDELLLTTQKQKAADPGSKPADQAKFTGKRIADLPPTPDLSKVKFGKPIPLLNGKDLTGWRLMDKGALNGWSVVDGVLQNRMVKEEGKHFGNLRTDAEFEDFNLKTDVRTLPGSNSGIYLRGIYEVQVMESFGKPLDPHNMGALYSRITPSVNAEKPVGEWQTLDITLVDRHLTVILNDKTIINNAPVLGCTGGAMTSDEFKPGPIYLQGDHTNVDYRNMVLRPVVK